MNNTIKKAFLQSLPVMAGYVVLGIAFGILLSDKGYSLIWAILMSLLIYAGSMQFVTINLLTGGASLLSAALMTLMVNARHLFYGVAMLDTYKNMGKVKPYLIFGLTDETYAVVCIDPPADVDKKKYYACITVFNQCYWITGSVIGSLLGSTLTMDTTGIDFAMTALFVIIFTEQILSTKDYLPAIIGVTSTLLCLIIFGSANFLIPSMICITISLFILGTYKERRNSE